MEYIKVTLPSNHDLVLFGDTHTGTILQHAEGIQECKEFIMSERSRYACHMGDMAEWRMVDHPYFDPATHDKSTPEVQEDSVVEDYTPISSRLLLALEGNHEYGLQRYGNMTRKVCKRLSNTLHTVRQGGFSCVLEVHDKYGLLYKAFLTHGAGTLKSNAKDFEQRQANMKASLKLRLQDLQGDCVIMAMGHAHRLLVVPPSERLYVTTKDGKLKQHYLGRGENEDYIDPDQRIYFCTGSFLKTFVLGASGYAERKLYKPVELGFINIKVRDREISEYGKIVV